MIDTIKQEELRIKQEDLLQEENKSLKEENRILRGKYDNLRSAFNSTYGMTIANNKDMRQTVTNEAMSELVARINELEKENESLKDEINKYKEALTTVDDALSEANTLLERMI
jgi:FtsZ-binding cell division protein ZapB